MKLHAKVGKLADALALADLLLDHPDKLTKRTPALMAVHISVADDAAVFTANVLDFSINVKVTELQIVEPGEVVVALPALAALIAGFAPDITSTLTTTGANLFVTAAKARFRLPTLRTEDFPPSLTVDPEIARVEITGTDMAHLLDPIAVTANERVSFYLSGVLLHDVAGDLVSVATDGHQLIRVAIPAVEFSTDRRCMIPAKAVAVLKKLLKSSKSADPRSLVVLRRSKALFAVEAATFTFTSRLIDAEYPFYEKAIPQASGNTAVCNRKEFISALRRLIAVAAKDGAVGAMQWQTSGELDVFLPYQPDDGFDRIAAETCGHGQVAFPLTQMIALLDELTGDRIHLAIGDAGGPICISMGDQHFLALQTTCVFNFQRNAA